jgi:dihydrofolate reductase
MKRVLVFVSTLDGKVTKWGDPFVRKWSSKEDQEYFSRLWRESKLVVVGSRTYDAERIDPSPDHLLVVMTSHPDRYRRYEVKNQVEFSDESPAGLVTRFENAGYDRMILAGGPHIATSFLKENLIDELWLTLEPRIFGTGDNFVAPEPLDVKLELIRFEMVNQQGTVIAKYRIAGSDER